VRYGGVARGVGAGSAGLNNLEHVPVFDDLANVVEPEAILASQVVVTRPLMETIC
jgi:hypothetical protein